MTRSSTPRVPGDRCGRFPAGLLAIVVALLLGVAGAPPASAAVSVSKLVAESQTDAGIDPCDYTAKDLQDARNRIPSDIAQYAPEFPEALDKAIADRGKCSDGGSGGSSASSGGGGGGVASPPPTTQTPAPTTTPGTPAPTTTTAPATPAPAPVALPSPQAQDGAISAVAAPRLDSRPATWTWAVLAVALVAAAGIGWLLITATGRIQWLQPAGHALGEAGWRISARWAEFVDWLRMGTSR
ncbi:MAG: hypothetical protein AB7G37_02740 [Solirubrobacteraceae bacterium]